MRSHKLLDGAVRLLTDCLLKSTRGALAARGLLALLLSASEDQSLPILAQPENAATIAIIRSDRQRKYRRPKSHWRSNIRTDPSTLELLQVHALGSAMQ
jgi:hypothetical protein